MYHLSSSHKHPASYEVQRAYPHHRNGPQNKPTFDYVKPQTRIM